MNCDKVQELLLTDYPDGEITVDTREHVERHLAVCARCREFERVARQTAFEPFKDAEGIPPPESLWYRIKDTIAEERDKQSSANVFTRLKRSFSIKRPVFVLSTAMLILIIAASVTTLLMSHRQSNPQDVVNDYLEEQIQYLAYFDEENGGTNMDYVVNIEDYFSSE